MQRQGGGAYQAPLSYLDNSYREPGTSSDGGADVLGAQPGLARPVLNPLSGGRRKRRTLKRRCLRGYRRRSGTCRTAAKRGGFYPSVMGSFTTNGAALLPATVYSGYKLIKNYNKSRKATRKNRKGRK